MHVVPVNQHEDISTELCDLTAVARVVVLEVLDSVLSRTGVCVRLTAVGGLSLELYEDVEVETCSVQGD